MDSGDANQSGVTFDDAWVGAGATVYDRFVHDHPRAAHPSVLSWETERTDQYDRVHWLVIDTPGARPSDVARVDSNTVAERLDPDVGLRGDARKEKRRGSSRSCRGAPRL